MVTLRVDHLQIATGLEADVANLLPGELGFSTDLLGLWIGTDTLPVLLARGAYPPWGRASGTIDLAGAAEGVAVVAGAATGTIDLDGAATGFGEFGNNAVATGTIDLDGAATGGATASGAGTGTITLDGVAAGAATASANATGAIDLAGAAVGSAAVASGATGSIGLAGSATGSATASATATGTITLAGAAGAGGTASGAATGTITLSGAAGAAAVASASASGSISLAGAATGGADYEWDGITDLCLATDDLVTILHLTGSCTGGVGSWSNTGGDCGVNIAVSAGAWDSSGLPGSVTSISPLVVSFADLNMGGGACPSIGASGTVSDDMTACAGATPCSENSDLTIGGPWGGGYTLTNTGTDSWSGSTGTCSAWVITWTGTTYHLSGNGNEIDATSWTCGPTHIYFDNVDASCDGFGSAESVDYYV